MFSCNHIIKTTAEFELNYEYMIAGMGASCPGQFILSPPPFTCINKAIIWMFISLISNYLNVKINQLQS